MALFELLFSSLLFGLVFSAPVNVTTATEETRIPSSTVSDLTTSSTPEGLPSTEFPKSPLRVQIGSLFHPKQGASSTLDKQPTTPHHHDHLLQNSPKPTPNTEIIAEIKDGGNEHAHSDQERRLPQTEAERNAASSQKTVRALPDGYGGPYFRQQPDYSQPDVREPVPDPYYREAPQVPGESDVLAQVPHRAPPYSDFRVPTEPQEQSLEPKDESVLLVDVEPIVREEDIAPPSLPYQEQISPEGVQENVPQGPYEPQAEEPPQIDDRPAEDGEPADVGQPEDAGLTYYPYPQREDHARELALEDDNLEEPPLPLDIDESEGVVGDPVPPEPPAGLVRGDLASPVLQNAPQYYGEEDAPPKLEYVKKEKYPGDRVKKYRY